MTRSWTVLVTGGAGFVGAHTVIPMLNHGYNVIVLDNLPSAKKPEVLKRIEHITNREILFYNVDLGDRDALFSIFNKHSIDCIIHFAALKAVGESCEKPLEYYKNNVIGSINLLEAMKAHNVKKIVYSSSATIYGTPKSLPIKEDHPTGQNLTNPYGKTKFFVEEMMKDLCGSDGSWSVISLRYFNPVGAHSSGRLGEDPMGIPNNLMPFISKVAVGKLEKLKVFGNDYNTHDGTGERDYIHIEDLAEGHLKALNKLEESSGLGFKAYNLGTGNGYTVLEVIETFKNVSGRDIKYEIVGRRAGDIDSSYADPTLARKELNWSAKRTLVDMCYDTWRWQSQNPDGFRS
ncbi:UDP-glucose 4-epimerase, putative [Pediculus humanus corporis]|uniref:UDP-glucose 4-epimerase n=1 Tax=Pediculus humanus subsp. corporis TaxID=121224 RepID=E0VTM8_PEDHC|nr:UDP-glucose 4-epimerase, putative [Pediculus humanus corporis]EEB16703.1 UDP-glucose 4-epimerase, putative [Pediculus humanus corporis]